MKNAGVISFVLLYMIMAGITVDAANDLYPPDYDLKEHRTRGYDCTLCHENKQDLKPLNHGGEFVREHAKYSRRQVCSACHSTSYCTDCHYNTQKLSNVKGEETHRVLIHQGNWINRHGIKAQTNNFRCISCHDTSYCSSCHATAGIASWNFTPNTQFTIHPPGWRNKNSQYFHGKHARNNIVVCASCHDSADKKSDPDCVSCHRFINPHPSNWSEHDYDSNTCKTCHGNNNTPNNSKQITKKIKKLPAKIQ